MALKPFHDGYGLRIGDDAHCSQHDPIPLGAPAVIRGSEAWPATTERASGFVARHDSPDGRGHVWVRITTDRRWPAGFVWYAGDQPITLLPLGSGKRAKRVRERLAAAGVLTVGQLQRVMAGQVPRVGAKTLRWLRQVVREYCADACRVWALGSGSV